MTLIAELTPRQIAVASLVARCYTTKHIADELSISPRRVQILISSIAYRIGADHQLDERLQVAQWYLSHVTQINKPKDAA